jgi:hypothetical protein
MYIHVDMSLHAKKACGLCKNDVVKTGLWCEWGLNRLVNVLHSEDVKNV